MNNLLIINPVSGGKRGKKYRKILIDEIHKNHLPFDIKYTEYRGHAIELVAKYAPDYEVTFVSGGDGTVFELMNGLPKDKPFKVGVFPIGTGNDFFASLNLPTDIKDLLKYYTSEKLNFMEFDLFEVNYSDDNGNGKYVFANVFGVGFDALVTHNMRRYTTFPGVTAYIAAVIKALTKLEYIYIELKTGENETIKGNKLLTIFGNTPRSGGGFYLTPNAEINSGKFEIGIIDRIGKFKLLRSLPLALINKIDRIREISFLTTDKCDFSLKSGYFAQADGEIISESLYKCSLRKIEHKIKVICG